MKLNERPMGELLEFYDHIRVPLSSLERDTRQGPYRYYGAQSVIDHIDAYLFDGEYILIAEDGANLVTRNEPIAFLVDGQFWVNNHAHIVRGKSQVADNYFLKAWLNNANIAGFVTGVAQPKLSQQNLKQIKIPLPPYDVQRAVTNILSAYDNLIENNRRRMALLEESAQLLYQEWFVHLRFPGHEHSMFVDSVLGRIPTDWKVLKLDELKANERYAINGGPFGSKLGTRDYVPSGVPVIRGGNLSESGRFRAEDFVFVTDEKASELHANLAKPGDIVVTQRGTLGQVGIIPKRPGFEHYLISQSQMKVTLNESLAKTIYIFYVLKSLETNASIKNRAASSGVPHINLGILKNLEILLPPHWLQELFTEYAGDVEKAVELYAARNRLLASARDLLLPRLMSGEVSV